MCHDDQVVAVFPGAFDPMTHGHLDIIQRASRLFTHLVVAVGHNPEKVEWFTAAARVEMIREAIAGMARVSVEAYEELTMDFVLRVGARVLVRGIRDTSDLREELQIANVNQVVGGVETVFLMTQEEHALTSSTLIKQIVEIGGFDAERLARMVPPVVVRHLGAKLGAAGGGAADPARDRPDGCRPVH